MRQPANQTGERGRIRVMLVDPDPMRRLALVAALREVYAVQPVEEGRDLLREVRARRPELVLIATDAARLNEALRSARVLRSDPTPPLLGLVHSGRRAPSADELLERSSASGLYLGPPEPARLVAWVGRLLAGERAVERLEGPRGLLGRLLKRR